MVKTKVKSRSWTSWAYLPDSLLKYDVSAGETVTTPTAQPSTTPSKTYTIGSRILKLKSPYMEGNDVKEMQEALNALGYNCGTADGIFGKNTQKGVKAFQTAADIEVDGEFGPQSKAALDKLRGAVATQQSEPPAEAVTEPTKDIEVYPIHGFIPDVSAHQEKMDAEKFAAGNDFAIFRARINGKDDEKFKEWATALTKLGFPFGVYDYVRLKSKEDAITQADKMFAICYPFKPKFYFLDTEELADGVTYKQEREFIKEYVKRLREWGVEVVGQYTGDARWNEQYQELEPIFDILWIAHWGSNSGKYEGQTIKTMSRSNKVVLHQYTSYGYIKVAGAPGINHRIDLNRLTGVKPLSYFTGRNYEGDTAAPAAESSADPAPKNAVTLTYTVQQNDTLWAIAKRYYGKGEKYTKIMEANGLNSTIIRTGQILTIPQE